MAPDDGTPTVSGSAPLGGGRLASDDAGSSDTPAEWLDLTALEAEAPAVLPPDVGDHYAGGAGSEITLAEATAASAVWVSTHGGRPADPAVAAARALPEVVDAVGEDVEVYADGRIRSSSDVLTALALGATAVFVGRPVIWGLATGGTDGVSRVLTGLSGDLAHTMAPVWPGRSPIGAPRHRDAFRLTIRTTSHGRPPYRVVGRPRPAPLLHSARWTAS